MLPSDADPKNQEYFDQQTQVVSHPSSAHK